MTANLSKQQRRRQNDRYRDVEPSDLHKQAFRDVLHGDGISEEQREEMVDRLYEPFPESKKNLPVDPWEPTLSTQDTGNGLGRAVVRHEYTVTVHISKKLWHQQPIGVLLRPINDEVRKAGEALISRVTPRSETVEDYVMPAKHVKLTLEPTPLWLAKWVGEDGYDTW